MLISQIVENIATKQSKDTAQAMLDVKRKENTTLDFILRLNAGQVKFHGVPADFDPDVMIKEDTPFGKNLQIFYKAGTPFNFLCTPPNVPGYDPAKKIKVFKNIANSIPTGELQLLLTAHRGELIDCKRSYKSSLSVERFTEILAILSDKATVEPVKEEKAEESIKDKSEEKTKKEATKEETIKISTESIDEIVEPGKTPASDELIQEEKPKGRGRPKMTEEEKAEAKKKREAAKNKE